MGSVKRSNQTSRFLLLSSKPRDHPPPVQKTESLFSRDLKWKVSGIQGMSQVVQGERIEGIIFWNQRKSNLNTDSPSSELISLLAFPDGSSQQPCLYLPHWRLEDLRAETHRNTPPWNRSLTVSPTCTGTHHSTSLYHTQPSVSR